MAANFTTGNLKTVVSLAQGQFPNFVGNVTVKDVKYDGDVYAEGCIELDIPAKDALMFSDLQKFETLLRTVWPRSFIQIGTKNRKTILYVYESPDL